MENAKPAGVISQSEKEIERVLGSLLDAGELVVSMLDGKPRFRARLLFVDPMRRYFIVATTADREANTALLLRPRATFTSDLRDLHVEFSAADPQFELFDGTPAVRLRFPEILVSHPRRAESRAIVPRHPPLHCVADSSGVASFDGQIIDIGNGGIGLIDYAAEITLEPGTVLKGCRIEQPGKRPVHVDIEVRYSRPVELGDGRTAIRSGCRFVDPSNEVRELIASFMER